MNLIVQQESAAVQAWKSPPCKNLNDAELFSAITQRAQKVCVFAGQKLPENVDVFAALIAEELRKTNCTIDQFKIAVDKGMVETDIYSASAPATYVKWVRTYLDDVASELIAYRANLRKMQEEQEEAEKKAKLTPEFILQSKIDAVELCRKHFELTGEISDPGSVAYKYLEEIGEIVISNEEKAKQLEIEVEKIKREEQGKAVAEWDKIIRVQIKSAIEQIENPFSELRFQAKKNCRANALKNYYAKQN